MIVLSLINEMIFLTLQIELTIMAARVLMPQKTGGYAMVDDTLRKTLALPSVDQLGFVVRSVADTMNYYEKSFGLGPWIIYEGQPEFTIESGRRVDATLKIAMAYSGRVQLELIEVVKGRSFYNDFLEKGEGLHHLGFMVNDLEKRLQRCRELGIEVIQRGQIKDRGVRVDYAYLDTVNPGGVVFEFIQSRLGPIPVKMSALMHKIVFKLGL